jgi:hypothetical protein
MAFMDAKSFASLKLRPIQKIFKKCPTLLRNMKKNCLCDLKDFAFENQV